MTVGLQILQAGPSLTVQDFGRIGYLDRGLSRGGAADMLALNEGAALLNQSRDHAALEMAGFGGVFEATGMLRIALTGAPMLTCLDGVALVWNASHRIEAGQKLSIGATTTGVFGYLSLGGGIDTLPFLGSRSTHLAGGIGRHLIAGDHLPAGMDTAPYDYGNALSVDTRFSGGRIRILPSAQTELFTAA
ncbi:MAG: urea amidolyase, partial [Paracoccaceae bacterium]|nr:urea amidolyase [Paracoccaceae bacterium]